HPLRTSHRGSRQMQPVSDIEITVIEPELAPRRPREPGIIQHPYTTSKSEGSMHVTERIKALWAVIEVAVEEAIIAAETIFGPKTGQEKKEFVVSKVLDLLRKLEEKQDI